MTHSELWGMTLSEIREAYYGSVDIIAEAMIKDAKDDPMEYVAESCWMIYTLCREIVPVVTLCEGTTAHEIMCNDVELALAKAKR